VLPTLGRIFRPVRQRNSAAEEKILATCNFYFFEGAFVLEKQNNSFSMSMKTELTKKLVRKEEENKIS
jgi:hypothetical protein